MGQTEQLANVKEIFPVNSENRTIPVRTKVELVIFKTTFIAQWVFKILTSNIYFRFETVTAVLKMQLEAVMFFSRNAGIHQYARGLLIVLMIEAANAFETSVNFYQTIQRYNPEDWNLRKITSSNSNRKAIYAGSMVHFEGSFVGDFAISLLTRVWRPKRNLFLASLRLLRPHYHSFFEEFCQRHNGGACLGAIFLFLLH
jgi:hypothetical protein